MAKSKDVIGKTGGIGVLVRNVRVEKDTRFVAVTKINLAGRFHRGHRREQNSVTGTGKPAQNARHRALSFLATLSFWVWLLRSIVTFLPVAYRKKVVVFFVLSTPTCSFCFASMPMELTY